MFSTIIYRRRELGTVTIKPSTITLQSSHTLTLSHSHTLTLSHSLSHTITISQYHSLTLSLSHTTTLIPGWHHLSRELDKIEGRANWTFSYCFMRASIRDVFLPVSYLSLFSFFFRSATCNIMVVIMATCSIMVAMNATESFFFNLYFFLFVHIWLDTNPKYLQKIPHTGDTNSLDRCG